MFVFTSKAPSTTFKRCCRWLFNDCCWYKSTTIRRFCWCFFLLKPNREQGRNTYLATNPKGYLATPRFGKLRVTNKTPVWYRRTTVSKNLPWPKIQLGRNRRVLPNIAWARGRWARAWSRKLFKQLRLRLIGFQCFSWCVFLGFVALAMFCLVVEGFFQMGNCLVLSDVWGSFFCVWLWVYWDANQKQKNKQSPQKKLLPNKPQKNSAIIVQ